VVEASIASYCWGVASLTDYRERFANRLRSLREAAGLSIEKASELGGLSTNFWGGVERVAQEPCLDSIIGFAKGLGISVRTLMTVEGDDTHDPERGELNTLLDLLTPEQLLLTLKISKLIYNYKTERAPRSEPHAP
jgi:transcriptional regulator with XRE-family HTH domain